MTEFGLQPEECGPECQALLSQLRRERAMLGSLLGSMIQGVLLVDASGRLAYWNPRAIELLSPGFAPAREWGAQELLQRIAALATNQTTALRMLSRPPDELHALPRIEIEHRTSGRLVQALLFPIHGEGNEDLGYGIGLNDITERRRADQVKARLLAMVAHELRAPLASIKGFATTLLRPDVEWADEERQEFLEIIDRESDRLSELVSELFDSSRIVLGEFPVEPEPTSLREIVGEAIKQANSRAPSHGYRFEAPAELPELAMDERRIRQVMHNLLDNAIKYAPAGTEIDIGAAESDGEVIVSVADRGPGIEPAEQSIVFDPFYRGKAAQGSRAQGLGLGLAICQGIVQAHGGRIWVEDRPGGGSIFSFSLPKSAAVRPIAGALARGE
jgi:signal transduction histidine kinase